MHSSFFAVLFISFCFFKKGNSIEREKEKKERKKTRKVLGGLIQSNYWASEKSVLQMDVSSKASTS